MCPNACPMPRAPWFDDVTVTDEAFHKTSCRDVIGVFDDGVGVRDRRPPVRDG